jgi:hypothetical protein
MPPNAGLIWSMDLGRCAAAAIIYFKTAPAEDSGTPGLALNIIDPIMLAAGGSAADLTLMASPDGSKPSS